MSFSFRNIDAEILSKILASDIQHSQKDDTPRLNLVKNRDARLN